MAAWVCTRRVKLLRDLRSGRVPVDGSCVVMHGAAGRRQLSAHVVAVNLITIGGPLSRRCFGHQWQGRAERGGWLNQQTVTYRWTAGATYMTDRP